VSAHAAFTVPLPGREPLKLGPRPVFMGILNVTPDSFSDGGVHDAPAAALAHAVAMLADGADVIDVGGESTRPGAAEVTTTEEIDRVLPVIVALREGGVTAPLSIDTYKAEVASTALDAGTDILNDVYGLQRDPEIAAVAAERGASVVAMHWDKARDRDRDLIGEIRRFFETTIRIAEDAGVPRTALILDPGFGFAKSLAENYELLHRLGELHALGYPMLVGTSRKSMIGRILDVPPAERLAGTLASSVFAYSAGAHIFRVHDVRPNREALAVGMAALYGPPPETN